MFRSCYVLVVIFALVIKELRADDPSLISAKNKRDLSRFGGGGFGGGGCSRRFRPRNSINQILAAHVNLYRIEELIRDLGLNTFFEDGGRYTVFAPRDIAFDKADKDLIARLYQSQYLFHAKDLVKKHFLNDEVCSTLLVNGKKLQAANGEYFTYLETSRSYTLTNPGNEVEVEPVPIVDFNNQASDGVVHFIDRLLLPKWVFQELFDSFNEYGYTTLKELVIIASMENTFSDASGRRTVFAPTNEAFKALDESALDCLRMESDITSSVFRSHTVNLLISSETTGTTSYDTLEVGVSITVTSGDTFIVNQKATVVDPDRLAYSGILHGIDKVILPDGFSCEFGAQAIDEGGTVLGILREEGMTTLVGLIEKAGLSRLFTDPNAEITIFAPIEKGFEDLSPQTLFCLTNSREALESLLRYHTLASMFFEQDLQMVQLLPTIDRRRPVLINGLTAQDGLTQINDAGVVEGDILASNGVIHKVSRIIHTTEAECM